METRGLRGHKWTENGWVYDPTDLWVDYVSLPSGRTLEEAFPPTNHERFDIAIKVLEI
jgi:hypothetical protein